MNALQVQRFDAFDGFVIGFARYPAEGFATAAIGQNHVVIFAGDAGDERNGGGQVFYFCGHGERRID